MNCGVCKEKECYLTGRDCTGQQEEILERYEDDPLKLKIMAAAAAIESEGYVQMPRVEEVAQFAKKMGCRHLGIAFCVGLQKEAGILERNYRRETETAAEIAGEKAMQTKQEIPAKDLEKEIIELLTSRATQSGGQRTEPGCNLQHGRACVLSTCHDNVPRATPVDFFCDGGLELWITAEPGGKIANIKRNPQVAVGIYEPVDHSIEQKSVQLWGRAEIINLHNNPDLFNLKWDGFGLGEAAAGMVEKMVQKGFLPAAAAEQTLEAVKKKVNMIRITPTKITLLHMPADGAPIRKLWENGKAYQQAVAG